MSDPVLEEIKGTMFGTLYRLGWLMCADVAVSFGIIAASPSPAPRWTYVALAAAGVATTAGLAVLVRLSRARLADIERRELAEMEARPRA